MPIPKKKTKKLRLYADENFLLESVEYLKSKKVNVIHAVKDLEFVGRDDKFHFNWANQNERIILTLDPDFLNNKLFPLRNTFGIIVLVIPPKVTKPKINSTLDKLLFMLKHQDKTFFKAKKMKVTLEQITIWKSDKSGEISKEVIKI